MAGLGEKRSDVCLFQERHKVVADQIKWEARVLLGLLAENVPAEVPQAIVIRRDGGKLLVTKSIPASSSLSLSKYFELDAQINAAAGKLGLCSGDVFGNKIAGADGKVHVIDVARWRVDQSSHQRRPKFPRYSDKRHVAKLLRAIAAKLQIK